MEIYSLKSTFSKIVSFDEYQETNIKKEIVVLTIININDVILVEYIEEKDVISYIKEQEEMRKQIAPKPQAQVVESKELVEAKNTILNTDPFGDHKHSGQALGEIVSSDMAWVEYALENMTNEYIKKRLQLIVDSMR